MPEPDHEVGVVFDTDDPSGFTFGRAFCSCGWTGKRRDAHDARSEAQMHEVENDPDDFDQGGLIREHPDAVPDPETDREARLRLIGEVAKLLRERDEARAEVEDWQRMHAQAIERLDNAVAAIKRLRIKNLSITGQATELEVEVERLTDERKKAKAALERYGAHQPGCAAERGFTFRCSCGYHAALVYHAHEPLLSDGETTGDEA